MGTFMNIAPVYSSVGRLFQQFTFQVPRYQRGYTWDEPQVDDFLRDVLKCFESRKGGKPVEHFFGSLVAVDLKLEGSLYRHCEIIDGQQRVATFVLFAHCIEVAFLAQADAAEKEGSKENCELARQRARTTREIYLQYKGEINRRTTLIDRMRLSTPDEPYFSALIKAGAKTPPKTDRESHNRLKAARDFFLKRLGEILATESDTQHRIDTLALFQQVLVEDCSVIHIVTDSQSYAYKLFQVLNDRGTSLSEGDLLRASTLEKVSSDDFRDKHEHAARIWDDVLSDVPEKTEKFLRHYYSSFQGKRPGQSSLFDEFAAAFFPKLEAPLTEAKVDSIVTAIEDIQQELRKYRLLVGGEWPYLVPYRATAWDQERLRTLVVDLDHTNCLPLLMAGCLMPEDKFLKLLNLVEKTAFRYKYICNLHIGSLTKVYLEQAMSIRTAPSKYKIATLEGEFRRLQTEKATDELFKSILHTMSYRTDGGNKAIKHLLITLEHYWSWFEAKASGNPKCRDTTRIINFSATTLEHIYPQSPDARTRNAQLDIHVHDLGNITLMPPAENDRAANASFEAKKPLFQRSTLGLNRYLGGLKSWNPSALKKRKSDLIDLTVKLFTV